MMVIDNKFEIGDFVYIKTDTDQSVRVVTGIMFRPFGCVFELTLCDETSFHYDFELSTDRNTILATNG